MDENDNQFDKENPITEFDKTERNADNPEHDAEEELLSILQIFYIL